MTQERGFTLIELVVVIFMVGILLIVLFNLFIGQDRIYRTQVAELNVTSSARNSLDDIDNFVRGADAVVDSHDVHTTGSQVLVLQIPAINVSNQIIPTTFDYVAYYLINGELYRRIYANGASARQSSVKELGTHITGLQFTYDSNSNPLVKEVTTDLTIQETAGQYSRAITVSSKSRLRNN